MCKWKRDILILKLKGVDDINRAELLRGLYVEVDEKDLDPLGEGEFYVYQLIGLKVVDEEKEIGKVVDMHEWGPYWTMEMETFEGKKVYIPFVKEHVVSVNLEEGVVFVKLPPGYIDQFP